MAERTPSAETGTPAPTDGGGKVRDLMAALQESLAAVPIARCPFCGHGRHDGTYCSGRSDCEDHDHPCACSYPDPGNFTEVPS